MALHQALVHFLILYEGYIFWDLKQQSSPGTVVIELYALLGNTLLIVDSTGDLLQVSGLLCQHSNCVINRIQPLDDQAEVVAVQVEVYVYAQKKQNCILPWELMHPKQIHC